jgi:outer membrane immunogenic protein
MRRLAVAAIISSAFISQALAADMAVRPAPAPMMAAPVYNWSGFYIGAHGGYAWGRNEADAFDGAGALISTTTRDTDGWFAGGQVGVNWQFHPNWLIGIEGDLSGANIKGALTSCTATGCAASASTNDWFGTLRGRVGLVFGPLLVYGTGGGAWMDNSVSRTITCTGGGCPAVSTPSVLVGQVATASSTLTGWVVGGGIEWGFAPGWTAKLEYQHMEFNYTYDYNYTLAAAFRRIDSDYHVNTIRVGINYLFNWGGGPGPVVARY